MDALTSRRSDIARRIFAENLRQHEPVNRVTPTATTREHARLLATSARRLATAREKA